MPPRQPTALGLVIALAVSLVALTPAASVAADSAPPPGADAPAASAHAHAAPMSQAARLRTTAERKGKWPVKQRVGVTLPVGTPSTPSTPLPQRLAAATITQDLVRGTISAKVKLRGKPTPTLDSMVIVALGKVTPDGTWCQSPWETTVYWYAYGTHAPGLKRNGASMELIHFREDLAKQDMFDCAYAQTWRIEPEGSDPYVVQFDGRTSDGLTAVLDKPNFKVKAPGKVKAKVKRWQQIKVKVTNKNQRVTAPKVKVKVKGKKVTSKVAKIGKLKPGKSRKVKVRMRVAPGHKGTAKIVVNSQGAKSSKKIRLR
ncbi:hypothetical protein [Nocardioides alcanivorans]|uniref:hypothetical protein n=1 Tax=Nocardioides alcanivorans TaxID=2897352 RepID=UPI001F26A966|nr:hypothetical protein [Nocardioides alcanivorans]